MNEITTIKGEKNSQPGNGVAEDNIPSGMQIMVSLLRLKISVEGSKTYREGSGLAKNRTTGRPRPGPNCFSVRIRLRCPSRVNAS